MVKRVYVASKPKEENLPTGSYSVHYAAHIVSINPFAVGPIMPMPTTANNNGDNVLITCAVKSILKEKLKSVTAEKIIFPDGTDVTVKNGNFEIVIDMSKQPVPKLDAGSYQNLGDYISDIFNKEVENYLNTNSSYGVDKWVEHNQ